MKSLDAIREAATSVGMLAGKFMDTKRGSAAGSLVVLVIIIWLVYQLLTNTDEFFIVLSWVAGTLFVLAMCIWVLANVYDFFETIRKGQ